MVALPRLIHQVEQRIDDPKRVNAFRSGHYAWLERLKARREELVANLGAI